MTLKLRRAFILVGLVFLGCSASAQETPSSAPATSVRERAIPEISKENVAEPRYPGVAACYEQYAKPTWGEDEHWRDVIVAVNYGKLPFDVDIAPAQGVQRDGFSACTLELVRDGKLPMRSGSLFATGFRVYRNGDDTTSTPKTQGKLEALDVRRTFYPKDRVDGPGSLITRCFAYHAPSPFAGAVLFGGNVRRGKVFGAKIIASTIRIPEVEACMVQVLQSIPFDEDFDGVFHWPMSYRQ